MIVIMQKNKRLGQGEVGRAFIKSFHYYHICKTAKLNLCLGAVSQYFCEMNLQP